MINLLAIDPGSHCGWASLCDGRIESGVQDFSLKRGESPGMRYIYFNKWLRDTIATVKPNVVIFEQPHHRGGAATTILRRIRLRNVSFICQLTNPSCASLYRRAFSSVLQVSHIRR